MKNSSIEWTHHTFNPWRGCTKVSAGCANCYAETLSKRNTNTLGIWGPNGTRVVASEATWKEPLRWNWQSSWWCDKCKDLCKLNDMWHCTRCGSSGEPRKLRGTERPRVFCASLADVFEDWTGAMLDLDGDRLAIYKPNGSMMKVRPYAEEPGPHCAWMTMQDLRKRLFDLIDRTPNLDWLLLTKRPENIPRMMPTLKDGPEVSIGGGLTFIPFVEAHRPNIWLGTSVENQQTADERIPHLLKVPAAVRFLSVEPLLGPVDLSNHLAYPPFHENYRMTFGNTEFRGVDWVIVGGESGPKARPCNVDWIRSIVSQCQAAGVPVFVKQLGSNPSQAYESDDGEVGLLDRLDLGINDRKGGDPEEWPEDLRVQEFPKPAERKSC